MLSFIFIQKHFLTLFYFDSYETYSKTHVVTIIFFISFKTNFLKWKQFDPNLDFLSVIITGIAWIIQICTRF